MKTVHALLLTVLFFSYLNGTTIKDIVSHTLQSNPKIKSIEHNTKANKYYIDESFGDYLPTLNYEGYIQDKRIIQKDKINGTTQTRDENGSYQQLKLNQNIYNGGLTKAKVEEAKHNYQANLIANIHDTEKIILDTIISYLDLLKNEELKRLTENDLEIHSMYLETAVQTEQVSGDVVDRLLVQNKILTAKEKLIQIKEDRKKAKTQLEKNIGKKIDDNICRPKIDYSAIPEKLNDVLTYGIKNSYNVLEEIEKIKAQKAVISQELARFLPSIDFQLTKELDNGIDIENAYKNNQSARITINYNLFNGLKDQAIYIREKKFLDEAQKTLDNISDDSKQKLEEYFSSFNLSKEKLEVLKEHVVNNKEILKVFGEQFDGGTRSFIDVLNQEEELYRKKSDLIDEEYKNYVSYYNLLFETSKLSDTILLNKDNSCQEIKVDFRVIEKKPEVISQELENLLSEDTTPNNDVNQEAKNVEKVNEQEKIKDKVNRVFNSLLDDIYNTKEVKKIDIKNQKTSEPIIDKKIEKIDESKNIIEENNGTLKDAITQTTDDKYTLVLGTILDENKPIENILKRYSGDDIFAYRFKSNGKTYIRILSGAFKTLKEAKTKMVSLDPKLLKNKPFIDNITKHQKLYEKYNNVSGDRIE